MAPVTPGSSDSGDDGDWSTIQFPGYMKFDKSVLILDNIRNKANLSLEKT
jgi:hypothetical protein